MPTRSPSVDRTSRPRRRTLRRVLVGLAVTTLTGAIATGTSAGALAAGTAAGAPVTGTEVTASRSAAPTACGNVEATPTLTVTPNTLSASATSTVTVTATDFLVPPHICGKQVFGGVYVFFGWVAPGGQWGPSWRSSNSTAGQFGLSYSYPGEGGGGETRDDGSGVVRLVSFTPGGTSGHETPFHIDSEGNWTTTINVRGALFSWKDIATGATNTVDCRAVQCGILTIGAHGKASRTNELFTPITFRSDGPPPTVAPGGVSAAPAPATSGSASPAAGSPSTGGKGDGATTPTAGSGRAPTTATSSDEPVSTTTAPASTSNPSLKATEASAGGEEAERQVVAGEAAGVQEFDNGGRSSGPVVAILALLLIVGGATGAGWWARRRRAPGSGGS